MPTLALSQFLQVSPRPSPTTTTNTTLVRFSVNWSKYFSFTRMKTTDMVNRDLTSPA